MEAGSDRAFALLFALIFLVIGLYPWVVSSGGVRLWSLGFAAVLGICGWLVPGIFHRPNHYWNKLGMLLGRFVSPIVLGLVFFVVVCPIALVARLIGNDPLRTKRTVKDSETYWIERGEGEDAATTMTQQY